MISQKITTTKQLQKIKNKTALTIINHPVLPVLEVERFFDRESEEHACYDQSGTVKIRHKKRLLAKA